MSEVDDILFSPISPEKAEEDLYIEILQQQNQISLKSLIPPHIVVNINGTFVAIGQAKGMLFLPKGDLIEVNARTYVVVVGGDYESCVVELLP